MPSIATGANAANRSLTYLGISGDGDSLSIGVGQLVHAIRRNLDMLYVIENNGVYGLTKGQFSASADIGTKSKRGEANQYSPIDPVSLALELGASFVARAFSGDKGQLVPILKAGLSHKGFAIIDVISPCVTFNDHEGSTKSYLNTRKKMLPVIAADFVPPASEITTEYAPGSAVSVQLHDGSTVRLRKLAEDYDTGNRQAAADEIDRHRAKGEVATGLFFLDTKSRDMHDISGTTDVPLSQLPFEKLCPGSAALDELQKSFR
jgi:2-oxoglutarate ferredoxin oxidoreductase subunit beta